MARPRKATLDSLGDLQKKAAVLEREMTMQRAAMDRLREMAAARPHQPQTIPTEHREGRAPR